MFEQFSRRAFRPPKRKKKTAEIASELASSAVSVFLRKRSFLENCPITPPPFPNLPVSSLSLGEISTDLFLISQMGREGSGRENGTYGTYETNGTDDGTRDGRATT